MAWQTPKTDWKAGDVPAASDFNRIEGDTLYLKDEVDSHKAAAAPHSGHETPTGAQAKAEAAAGAVQAALDAHKTENASTSQKGHVQLSTSTTSTSTSLAATASAVRAVRNMIPGDGDLAVKYASGSYTGTGAYSRTLTIGFEAKYAWFYNSTAKRMHMGINGINYSIVLKENSTRFSSVAREGRIRFTTNGFDIGVGSTSSYTSLNDDGEIYYWAAIG